MKLLQAVEFQKVLITVKYTDEECYTVLVLPNGVLPSVSCSHA